MEKIKIEQEELDFCFKEIADSIAVIGGGLQLDIERAYEVGLDNVHFTEDEVTDFTRKYNQFFKAYEELPDVEKLVFDKRLKKFEKE